MTASKKMAAVMKEIAAAHSIDLGHVDAYLHLENPPWMALSVEVIGEYLVSVGLMLWLLLAAARGPPRPLTAQEYAGKEVSRYARSSVVAGPPRSRPAV